MSYIKIEKFTGKNSFSLWCIKMRALLKQQGIWAPLSDQPAAKDDANFAEQEEKAHSMILLCLADEVIYEVADEETAAGLWLKLESLYMTKSLTNKLLLKQRLFSLRMKEGTPLKEHLEELNSILMDLRNIDVKVEDEDAALILLVSLPASYENFVNSFCIGKDCITLEEVRSSLHTRELRQKASGSGGDNPAVGLVTTSFDKSKWKNKNKGKSKPKTNPKDICNYCKEPGHWKKDCPKKKKKAQIAAVAQEDSVSEVELVLSVVNQKHLTDQWVLDSGCSYHMCPNKEYFSTYEKKDGGNVLMGNDAPCKTVGIGSVQIRMHDGVVRTLTDVRHVPELKKNLISLGVMDSKGFKYSAEGGVMKISKGASVGV